MCNNDKIAKNMVSFDKWAHPNIRIDKSVDSFDRWYTSMEDNVKNIFVYEESGRGGGDIVSENAVRNGTDI